MKTTGARIVGVLTACLLGLTLSGPPSAQAEANTASAGAKAKAKAKVTARTVSGKLTGVAPTADGRHLIAVKDRQLIRYRIKPKRIREVGRSKSIKGLRHLYEGDVHLAVHPRGRFAYVAVQPWRKSQKNVLLVFNIARTKPKLVKTVSLKDVYPTKAVQLRNMAMRPDGKRIYLAVRGDLITLRMGSGKRGELQSVESGKKVGWWNMAVTPDGSKLITGINRGESASYVQYRVWDISGTGAPAPGPEQQIDVSEFDFDRKANLVKIVPAPNNTSAFVQIDSWADDYANTLIARVGLADGGISAHLGDPHGVYTFEQLLGRSPSGRRVYGLNRGPGGSTENGRDPFLARADSALTAHQRLKPGRFALEKAFAVSPSGKTKGLVYSTQKKNGKRYLVSIRN